MSDTGAMFLFFCPSVMVAAVSRSIGTRVVFVDADSSSAGARLTVAAVESSSADARLTVAAADSSSAGARLTVAAADSSSAGARLSALSVTASGSVPDARKLANHMLTYAVVRLGPCSMATRSSLVMPGSKGNSSVI